jgi:TolB-like protein/Tfp pilus assembly protein PilF
MRLISELRRRNVLRMAVLYVVAAWLIMQVAEVVIGLADLPDWIGKAILALLAIGFPIALIVSWFYELTPEGISLDKDVEAAESITHVRGRRMDFIVISMLCAAVLMFAYDKWWIGPPPEKSIAVLAFENMSGDPDQEYFSDGISDELLNLLAHIPDLTVISRSSSFSFKGKDMPIPTIAEQLNVAHVLEGSVRKAGKRVRITAQLIEARSDAHLWSETYDRELDDIIAIQEDIARVIARELLANLSDIGSRQVSTSNLEAYDIYLEGRRPANPEAYEVYLKGRHHLNKWSVEGFAKGLEYFQQAVEMDPNYAPAYTGLAESYNYLCLFNVLPPKEACPKSRAIVMKALELDDTMAEAYASLADVKFFYDWDWKGAEREYKRAIELNPSYAIAHNNYAFYLTVLTRHDDALAEIRRARELDPVSLTINSDLGWAYYFARQYDEAILQFRRALELDPYLAISQFGLGCVYTQKEMFAESVAAFQKAVSLSPSDLEILAGLGYAYAVVGRREDALKIVARLRQPSEQMQVPSFGIATIYIGLDNKDEALVWLEIAYEERHSQLVYIQVEPVWDPLRSDPRFQDLVRRMNFPE